MPKYVCCLSCSRAWLLAACVCSWRILNCFPCFTTEKSWNLLRENDYPVVILKNSNESKTLFAYVFCPTYLAKNNVKLTKREKGNIA